MVKPKNKGLSSMDRPLSTEKSEKYSRTVPGYLNRPTPELDASIEDLIQEVQSEVESKTRGDMSSDELLSKLKKIKNQQS